MDEQIKQIAERLRGLRDALELSPEEVAKACQLSTEEYLQMESGTVDISVRIFGRRIRAPQRKSVPRDGAPET